MSSRKGRLVRAPKAVGFWQDVDDAAFEVAETDRLSLPYTRFRAYCKGFEDGYRQADEEPREPEPVAVPSPHDDFHTEETA